MKSLFVNAQIGSYVRYLTVIVINWVYGVVCCILTIYDINGQMGPTVLVSIKLVH